MSGRGGRGRGDRGSGSGDRGRGGGDSSQGGTFRGFPPRGDSPSRAGRGGAQGGRGDGGPRGGRGGGAPRGGYPVTTYAAPTGIPEPRPDITKAEDDYVKQIKSSGLPDITALQITDGAERFPRRPGYGTKGKPVKLWANYFELIPPTDLQLYRYSIKVTEKKQDVVGKKLNQVFRLLLDMPPFAAHRRDIVTDFKAQIISRVEFDDDAIEAAPKQIQYRAEGEDEPRINAPYYNIAYQPAGSVTVSDLTDYLTSTNPRAVFDKQPILQALNIFLGHYTKSSPSYATMGSRSFAVNPPDSDFSDLGAGLRAIRGFFASVRVATARILVNVNVSHAPFYDPVPLDQSIKVFGPAHRFNKVDLQKFLRTIRIRTNHLKPKVNKAGHEVPRVKTIFALATRNDGRGTDGVSHPPQVSEFGAGPKDVKFWVDDGPAESASAASPAPGTGKSGGKKGKAKSQASAGGSDRSGAPSSGSGGGRYVSVADHFMNNYRMKTNERLPVVNVGTTKQPSYLPAEACEILPGQSSQAKLGPDQTASMIAFAVRAPWLNATSIDRDSPNEVGLVPQVNGDISRFGVTIKTRMITVPGRILENPTVKYGREGVKMFPASWNMENSRREPLQFNAPSTLTSWRFIVLKVGDRMGVRNSQELRAVMSAFHNALTRAGIKARQPEGGPPVSMANPDDPALEEGLKDVKEDLCLVILPEKHTVLYNRVKTICDLKLGVHTVCVVGSKVTNQRGQDKYMANVGLKFNLKLGGTNQKIDDAKLGLISEGKTMVVGIDVTHPSPGSASNAPSVAGMVASVDKYLAQWPADLRVQEKARQESVSDLTPMLKTRLNLWGKANRALPENILIYRDGVSEGQYEIVLRDELPKLRKACEEVYPATDLKRGLPHMTIIIVGKRHHTRFFPTNGDSDKITDKTGNPLNGTVVDRHVTEARNWDFFLQAHNALQGTARPAHYFIILDEIFGPRRLPPGFASNADVLEDLTHNMCYLFGRATKAVSICPPAYYADLVCERARCYLSQYYDMATPSQTPAASESGTGTQPTTSDIQIHPKLKDTMFYI